MVVLQAESKLAAINMVYGGAACGKRVMTSSSSPGISLMCEGLSYLAEPNCPACWSTYRAVVGPRVRSSHPRPTIFRR